MVLKINQFNGNWRINVKNVTTVKKMTRAIGRATSGNVVYVETL